LSATDPLELAVSFPVARQEIVEDWAATINERANRIATLCLNPA
jgi:hypothetical protein